MTTTKSIAELNRIIAPIMQVHLKDSDWTWGWDRATTRAGVCSFKQKRISFSREVLPHASEEEVRNTALHEVAHYIAGGHAGHGPIWARVMRSLGGNPERSLNMSGTGYKQKVNWIGSCPGGHKHERQRLTAGMREGKHSCGQCSPRFDRAYIIRWTKA